MMRAILCTLACLAATASLAAADYPYYCDFDTLTGTWTFYETDRRGDPSRKCSVMGTEAYQFKVTLEYPNVAVDEIGNHGTWTVVYNQGFQVDINERTYWAKLHYGYPCTVTQTGWSHDDTVRHWSCYYATQDAKVPANKPLPPPRDAAPEPSPALLDAPFVNSLARVSGINRAQTSWRAKAYPQHEKYTLREMIRRGGAVKTIPPGTTPATPEQKAAAAHLPENWDWRDVGGLNYLSPVRDQGGCGSCYSYAATAMVEARMRIKTNFSRLDIFSTQDVVSCNLMSDGCGGGMAFLTGGRYANEQGFVAESCNEYEGWEEPCDTSPSCARTYVDEYEYLGGYYGASNEELMMMEIVTNGPFAVGYLVLDDFYYYEGGIYHHVEAQQRDDFDPYYGINHAVTLVGYGVEPSTGEKFWTVKNSWGDWWGESGFFRIRRGTNEVGIESLTFVSTPIP